MADADRVGFQLPLSGSRSNDIVRNHPAAILSTPSLGITHERRLVQNSEIRFQLPLSGSQATIYKEPGVSKRIAFNPLSGSHV